MTGGLILAAGESSRMGRRKAFLRHEGTGRTFLAHLVGESTAAGLDPIFVVGRAGDAELERSAAELGATYIPNSRAADGQLSSIQAGLDRLDRAIESVVVMPVDVPLITAAVIGLLLQAVREEGVSIARAVHEGRHGHPVVFARDVFDELRHADPATGARSVVRGDPHRLRDIEVGEAGVTVDIDTPEDYFRVFGRRL